MVGNLPNFDKIDVLRCLLLIEKPVSRTYLSKALELGEGTIRSILGIFKKKGILVSTNIGHLLSDKGKNIWDKLRNSVEIKRINKLSLFPNKKIIIVHIKNPSKPEKAVVLRDAAVKNGAEGALILKYEEKLKFYQFEHEENLEEVEKQFNLGKDDLVIIAFADSYKEAERGAIASSMLVDDRLKEWF